ncbi:unnamed protein product [Closterium sp. NIES-64]|nr:unnamed protein product [Closterium sp. NIES-64]
MEGEEDSSRAIPGASLGGLPTPASRASFRLGSVFNGQEIGWDDAIATRRREEVREWESLGPGPVTEEQGTRGMEKDPDWRPAPGEAAGTSGGSGDEGWGGRGAGQAGGSGARGSGAAAKRPRPSGPVGSGAGGAGPASNSQPRGAAAGGSEGSGAAGAGTSAAAAGGAPLGGSTGAGAAAVIASQRSDRAGRTPTDEELDPWTEEVLRNAEPGLVRGMFSEKDVNEARNCKICKKKISWKGSCTSTGKRHLKRSHYPSLQIWCRRFKDPNKPDNLTFPDGGWGPDVPDQTAWPWEHAATWPRIVQTPDSAVTGGSEAGGSRQMSMAAFVTPRVHGQQLREGLVLLFAAADLPFRLVECREFKAFVQMLNPGAALLLGSRHRLARDMQAYGEAAREDMRQLLVGDGLAGRMSLTFDIWTGENNVAFMGVTAHYVTSDFQLKQAVIDFRELKGSHTGDLIADELEEVLREWGLEKMLFAVTCDNAENNSRAMRLLAGVPDARPGSRPRHPPLLSRWRHFSCMAHVVNLAVQAALKVDEVAEPLKRLRDVANYIGWSTLRTDRFFELQKGYAATRPQGPPGSRRPSGPLRLIVDCVTRWGSTLHMVNRGFELRMPIAMFFDDSDVRMVGFTCMCHNPMHVPPSHACMCHHPMRACATIPCMCHHPMHACPTIPCMCHHPMHVCATIPCVHVPPSHACMCHNPMHVPPSHACMCHHPMHACATIPCMCHHPMHACPTIPCMCHHPMHACPTIPCMCHHPMHACATIPCVHVPPSHACMCHNPMHVPPSHACMSHHPMHACATIPCMCHHPMHACATIPCMHSSISKETKKAWDAIRLTDAHWDDLAELRDFLTPFEQVTLFAEGSLYPTLSAVVPQYNALIDLQEKAQRTPGISPLRSSLITAALSKLERHMGGVSEEAAIATFLDPRQKLAPFKHRVRAAEGNSRGTTLELGPDRVKALVRARLPEYQAASTTALRDGGEVTSARGAGVHASAGGGAVDASANVSIQSQLFAAWDAMEAEEGEDLQDEVDQYLAEGRQRGGSALEYWRSRETLKGLRAMAKDYLGVPASSAASERAFSQSRNIITWQRHRLAAGQVRASMLIKTWQDHHPSGTLAPKGTSTTNPTLGVEDESMGL